MILLNNEISDGNDNDNGMANKFWRTHKKWLI